MPAPHIKLRAKFFVAVEGESEQSFIKWLQVLSSNGLHIHLEVEVLGGGGYKSMLQRAARVQKQEVGKHGAYQASFLVVDSDRAERGDWSIPELRVEAAKHKIVVFAQNPNHEGLLFRMMPAKEREILDASSAETKLKSLWPNYQKPMNAAALGRQFSLDDLLRVAREDSDLETLLRKIGLMRAARGLA